MRVNKSSQWSHRRSVSLRLPNADRRGPTVPFVSATLTWGRRRITSVVMDTKGGTNKIVIVEGLTEARERTRFLLRGISEEDLTVQHDPIMSPLIWDYGHIGNYEELWLLQNAHGKMLSKRELYDMYDASLHPREERPSLHLLDRNDADMYLDAVRTAVLKTLEEADFDGDDPLLEDGFVYNR